MRRHLWALLAAALFAAGAVASEVPETSTMVTVTRPAATDAAATTTTTTTTTEPAVLVTATSLDDRPSKRSASAELLKLDSSALPADATAATQKIAFASSTCTDASSSSNKKSSNSTPTGVIAGAIVGGVLGLGLVLGGLFLWMRRRRAQLPPKPPPRDTMYSPTNAQSSVASTRGLTLHYQHQAQQQPQQQQQQQQTQYYGHYAHAQYDADAAAAMAKMMDHKELPLEMDAGPDSLAEPKVHEMPA